jgi:hypothetical protein
MTTLIMAAIGTFAAHALFYWILGVGKNKRLQKMEDEAAERNAIVPVLKAENSDLRRRNDLLAQDNAEMRLLLMEASNHGRNWRAKVHEVLIRRRKKLDGEPHG